MRLARVWVAERVAERLFDARARPDPRPTRRAPAGAVSVARETLARACGLPVVWSGPNGMAEARFYPGAEDLIAVPRDAERIFCVGAGSLPEREPWRSREACCRLAYGFRDWAMGAALARRHADIRRELGCPPGDSLWLFLRERGALPLSENVRARRKKPTEREPLEPASLSLRDMRPTR